MLYETFALICVAVLWGVTNPLIKNNSTDIIKIQTDSSIKQFFLELKYLATNFKYLIPMGLNQLGSVLYFLTLQNVDLSLAVPVANSLTFVFTAFSAWALGEQFPRKGTIIGVVLILFGTTMCCIDKYLLNVNLN